MFIRECSFVYLTQNCTFQTAILLLRIDDIVSGTKKAADADKPSSGPQVSGPTEESMRDD